MTNDLAFLRVKLLSQKTTRAQSSDLVMLNCAKHNLREIVSESRNPQHDSIDPGRSYLNVILRGCDKAAGVAEMAQNMMRIAGFKIQRLNATLGTEIIFSLPTETQINCVAYFRMAVEWAERYFNSSVITAICHFDQHQPHCHAIFLPVRDGTWLGSEFFGRKAAIKAMHADFHESVGKQHGLRQATPHKRLNLSTRRYAATHALTIVKLNPDRLKEPAVIQALTDLIAADPERLLTAMQLPMPAQKPIKDKSFVEIMTTPCRPEKIKWSHDKSLVGDFPAQNIAVEADNKTNSYPVLVDLPSGDFIPSSATASSTSAAPSIALFHVPPSAMLPVMTDADTSRLVERDDDHTAGTWNADTGEFITLPSVATSNKARASAAVQAALASLQHRLE
jgi:hypothetical protein